jgi:hypothetical protein
VSLSDARLLQLPSPSSLSLHPGGANVTHPTFPRASSLFLLFRVRDALGVAHLLLVRLIPLQWEFHGDFSWCCTNRVSAVLGVEAVDEEAPLLDAGLD